ncbi:hypothetical protein FOMPIDRAFT_1119408 [Fomitopsis schrenkii]|uniref:VIT domain-containing protein n=1 Tax=Fomitopsis schrenkii TaxID=2126942 RepID=S8FK61_FOMSC|nr:hypothetical protein FOMPIDRAFT_1119408 [Fomitopsis schrenkii]
MTSSLPCGCLFRLPSGRETHMPLIFVSAEVHIVDVLARVTLTQHFANVNRTDIPTEAKYVFPVPAGGAVCAFEMHTADGKVVVGEVKEARQAEAEFKEAVAQKKTAGLLVKAASDVFTMSLGAIPPKQDLKTKVTYVIELADDELLKQIRFSLPTYIGERYGVSPTTVHNQDSSKKHAKFTLTADVQTTSAIEQVVSPSHTVKVVPQESDTRCRVVFDSSAGARLDKDFVLSIKASKIDAPRCVAEVNQSKRSVALSLTLVPRFGVQTIDSQEYVFLIDRSGSMSGQSKMDYAKKALLIMLKSLPANDTTFNIFSFGSEFSSLWPASQPYTEDSLSTALLHVDSMDANMGGTEITSALSSILRSRITTRPTSVFVLTDGEVWDVDTMLDKLRTNVAAAGEGSYLRVFTLGVGHGASTALCNGLARAGNGLCLMTTQSEELAGKCARLLKASRVPPSGNLRNVRVDWGYAGPDSSNVKASPEQKTKPSAPAQAPSVVPDFYPGNRFIVSAILSNTTQVPEFVVLRGETPDGTATEFKFPVHAASFQKPWPPLIHTLAAHRIIQELEDGYLQCLGIAKDVDSRHHKGIARSAIVRYSTGYQLASKYASFIAVEKDKAQVAVTSDDSEFEVLSETDIDPEEWVDDIERPSETPEASAGEGPSSIMRIPDHHVDSAFGFCRRRICAKP